MTTGKTYTSDELAEVLRLHRLWCACQDGGQGASMAGAQLARANLADAYLAGADLHGADLHGADLHGADLSEANLMGADLSGANLRDASLVKAYLDGAALGGACLRNCRINWDSHQLVGELLRRGAGNNAEWRMVAGLVLLSTDWGWSDFLKLYCPAREWSLSELRKWLLPGELHPVLRPG